MQHPCVRIPPRIQVDGLVLRIRQILGSRVVSLAAVFSIVTQRSSEGD